MTLTMAIAVVTTVGAPLVPMIVPAFLGWLSAIGGEGDNQQNDRTE